MVAADSVEAASGDPNESSACWEGGVISIGISDGPVGSSTSSWSPRRSRTNPVRRKVVGDSSLLSRSLVANCLSRFSMLVF